VSLEPDGVEHIYEGKLIDVVVERWGDHEREIVQHPGAVAIVAIDVEGCVVLVRQLREPARKHLLELPAGTLERGEDPLDTARRELIEETGLHGGEWRLAASFWTTPGFSTEYMRLYVATGVVEGESQVEDDEEIELVRWPVDEIAGRLDEIEDAKSLAGLLLYLRER
jgi:ADP-ribose pyrophosphatase